MCFCFVLFAGCERSGRPVAPVQDTGFLPNTARDWIAIIGTVGTLATFAGLLLGWHSLKLARRQMAETTRAAEAASKAAIDALTESHQKYQRYAVVHAAGLLKQASGFVLENQWRLAALVLNYLAETITHISDPSSVWEEFALRLREIENSFNRVAAESLKAASVQTKWHRLYVDLSSTLAKQSSPFNTVGTEKKT